MALAAARRHESPQRAAPIQRNIPDSKHTAAQELGGTHESREKRGTGQCGLDMPPPSELARALDPARDRGFLLRAIEIKTKRGVGCEGAAAQRKSRARAPLCRVTAAKAARTLPGALSPTPKAPPRERARAHAGLRSLRVSPRLAARRVAARRAIL